MMKTCVVLLLLAMSVLGAFVCVSGCSNDDVPDYALPELLDTALRDATDVELISVDPTSTTTLAFVEAENGVDVGELLVDEWIIVDRTFIDSSTQRSELFDAIRASITAGQQAGDRAECFNPRHALQFNSDGETHVLILCFECLQIRWYIDEEYQRGFATSDAPTELFDSALIDNGAQLAPSEPQQ